MQIEDHQLWKAVQALTKRIELLEAMVGSPTPHNDFATPVLREPLPDSVPRFMEPNTRVTN
jgi:hypothetical protein